jgi:insulysin
MTNILVAEADSAEIAKLTKADIVDYFKTIISPQSTRRAKLCIHLLAQGQANAAKMTNAEKLNTLQEKLSEMLEEEDVEVDPKKLSARIKTIDPATANAESVSKVIIAYLTEDADLDEEEVAELMETGQAAMGALMASAGLQQPVELEKAEPIPDTASKEAVVIKDVQAYKAQLQTTTGPQPVKHITEFEELEPKL